MYYLSVLTCLCGMWEIERPCVLVHGMQGVCVYECVLTGQEVWL